jgi:hypothetical protein
MWLIKSNFTYKIFFIVILCIYLILNISYADEVIEEVSRFDKNISPEIIFDEVFNDRGDKSRSLSKSGGSEIILDGFFYDWYDKPWLFDDYESNVKIEDNILLTAWHTDEDNFYITILRYGYKNLSANWRPYVKLFYAEKTFELRFNYKPKTRKVFAKLYDTTNGSNLIWSDNGKWGGQGHNEGYLFEGYVPLEEIVGTTVGGYELKAIVFSKKDRAPNSGEITITSLPTLSVTLEIILAIFGVLIITKNYFMKGKTFNNVK